jgi:hypothetical protein
LGAKKRDTKSEFSPGAVTIFEAVFSQPQLLKIRLHIFDHHLIIKNSIDLLILKPQWLCSERFRQQGQRF